MPTRSSPAAPMRDAMTSKSHSREMEILTEPRPTAPLPSQRASQTAATPTKTLPTKVRTKTRTTTMNPTTTRQH